MLKVNKIDFNESCVKLLSADSLAKLRWCLDNVIPATAVVQLILEQVI